MNAAEKNAFISAPGGEACAPAAAERIHRVRASDLPISCPLPEECLWNAHPKVYLPLDKSHPEAVCPYCSTRYILETNTNEKDQKV